MPFLSRNDDGIAAGGSQSNYREGMEGGTPNTEHPTPHIQWGAPATRLRHWVLDVLPFSRPPRRYAKSQAGTGPGLALLIKEVPSDRSLLPVTGRSGRRSAGRRRLAGAGAEAQGHDCERDDCDVFHDE